MDLNHLNEFVALAETGNFLDTAERLFLSQSTLSKHIRRMEQELGVSLFHRTTRSVELSEQGALLLPYARQILQAQQEYTEALARSLTDAQNQLRIASIPALAEYGITELMKRFRTAFPDAAIQITQNGTAELKELLRRDECELAFLREVDPEQDDGLERIPYARDRLVAVLPQAHPLANHREPLPLTALRGEDLLLIEPATTLYRICCDACLAAGFHPRVAYTDHKPDQLIDFVEKEMGVALLMEVLARHHLREGLAMVALTPETATWIHLAHRRRAPLSPAARGFLDCLTAQQTALV